VRDVARPLECRSMMANNSVQGFMKHIIHSVIKNIVAELMAVVMCSL